MSQKKGGGRESDGEGALRTEESARDSKRVWEKEAQRERELLLSIFRPSSKSLEMEINGRSERGKKLQKSEKLGKRKCRKNRQIKTIPEWN